jgi:hypothetical protein
MLCLGGGNARAIWFFGPAVLDPASGKVEKIPLQYDGDVIFGRWREDGLIAANGSPIKTELWRFRPVKEQ